MTELMGTALPAGFLKITLDIAADGTLTGNGGCNAYSAKWSLSGTTLTLTDLVTNTGGTCDATTQGLEQSYFSVIPYLGMVTVTDRKLVLGSSISPSVTFTFEPAS
jgi:heat shock protein HslJ